MSAVIEITAPAQVTNGSSVNQNPKLRQITVEEYDSMIDNGIFDTNDKIELLNGVIIEKIPKETKHSSATDRASRVFNKVIGDKLLVRNQNPVWLDRFSEPEPDIVLASPKADDYDESHPTPNEIYLVMEISDSTIYFDRNAKWLAYAKAGIRQYLLLNVQDRTIEDHREPNAGRLSVETNLARRTNFYFN